MSKQENIMMKERLYQDCKRKGLPVKMDDSKECLELIYSLARANNWVYKSDGNDKDIKIEKTIRKIRNFIENGYYSII